MLKIYGTKASSNVQKVLWCCSEIGVPFERDENIGGPSRKDRTPTYVALNPNGLIPTIDEDGFILWESNVIVRYLSAKHSMGKLCPVRSQASRRRRALDGLAADDHCSADGRCVPRAAAEARGGNARGSDQGGSAESRRGLGILDARLADRPFVGGATLTMGDIALGNAVHRWFKLPVERPDLPNVRRWYDRFCERPGYREHIASI